MEKTFVSAAELLTLAAGPAPSPARMPAAPVFLAKQPVTPFPTALDFLISHISVWQWRAVRREHPQMV